ncbi:hypothetical protein CEK29_15370 [Bordetella genomosp. 5]|nr:hypothetical protein CEK29_15370 [Bordetella genomosp. 5]
MVNPQSRPSASPVKPPDASVNMASEVSDGFRAAIAEMTNLQTKMMMSDTSVIGEPGRAIRLLRLS